LAEELYTDGPDFGGVFVTSLLSGNYIRLLTQVGMCLIGARPGPNEILLDVKFEV